MSRAARFLLWHLLGGAVAAVALVGVCALVELRLSLPLMIAGGLAAGAAVWLVRIETSRADGLDAPRLDLDVDYALPHGQDVRVRRLEDLIHGAQPSRRMTARGLARTLAEIAEERARDPQAPPLSPELQDLLDRAQRPDAEEGKIGSIDRRTLHRALRELVTPCE
ncbi:hypothetical protein [Brachybacterium sp. YJGR34]|uniref:hypothetical protein n=1 Tax=Brachybacterium sp. YJGR34 TaxID=2059911 RepID=UPI000E0B7FB1|nr:hypothetical protein [Brachybacterium sp. YJGR34]